MNTERWLFAGEWIELNADGAWKLFSHEHPSENNYVSSGYGGDAQMRSWLEKRFNAAQKEKSKKK